jgi:hypothetical protein
MFCLISQSTLMPVPEWCHRSGLINPYLARTWCHNPVPRRTATINSNLIENCGKGKSKFCVYSVKGCKVIQVHSFLISVLDVSGEIQAPAYPADEIADWVCPRASLDVLERRKGLALAGNLASDVPTRCQVTIFN